MNTNRNLISFWKKYWILLVVLGWTITFFLWLLSLKPITLCCDNYHPDFHEKVSYAAILADHVYLGGNAWIICLGFQIVAVVIIFLVLTQGKKRILLLILPAQVLCCITALGSIYTFIPADGTTIQHLDTITFDEHTFHLALGNNVAGGMDVYYENLLLFECENGKENCQSREINRYGNFSEARFSLGKEQLHIEQNGVIIYTLDQREIAKMAALHHTIPLDTDNVTRLQLLMSQHYDSVWTVEWSSQQHMFASSGETGIWVYEISEETIKAMPLNNIQGRSISFSADGRYLATADSVEQPVYIWNIENSEMKFTLPFTYPGSVQFSPNEELAAGNNSQIIIYNLLEERIIQSFAWQLLNSPDDILFGLGGQILVVTGYNTDTQASFIQQINRENKETLLLPDVATAIILLPVEISSDGKFLAYPASTNEIYLWDLETQTISNSIDVPYPITQISDLALDPTGNILAMALLGGYFDKSIISFWDISTGRQLSTVELEEYGVSDLDFSPDGTLLVSANNNKSISLWGVPGN